MKLWYAFTELNIVEQPQYSSTSSRYSPSISTQNSYPEGHHTAGLSLSQHPYSYQPCLALRPNAHTVGPKKGKKSKAQKEAERLQAEEDERKAEILRARREAERLRKAAEDAKRLKEQQVATRIMAGFLACRRRVFTLGMCACLCPLCVGMRTVLSRTTACGE